MTMRRRYLEVLKTLPCRWLCRAVLLVGLAAAAGWLFPGWARAQAVPCGISYEDPDHDGRPEVAIVRCPFAGHAGDTAYVYDRAEDMLATDDWKTSTDWDDDLWVLDAEGDGRANLILDFYEKGSTLVADVYDDQDGDGEVSYRVANGSPVILESKHPTLRMMAADGHWVQDERINFNLSIEVDGPVRTTFAGVGDLARQTRDGILDSTIQVHDTDRDGLPDYELRQARLTLRGSGIKTELIVNTADDEHPLSEDWIFWPYLGPPVDHIKPIGASPPPIQVDWSQSRLMDLAEFVASRGNESNWFIYSMSRFGEGEGTFADMENPFAFYDMAADGDGVPELSVRSEYYDRNDPSFESGRFSQPIESIRYSWDQDNDGMWDYKVDVTGRHEITTTVDFSTFTVHTVPYTEFPTWVVGQRWDTGTLVAVEGDPYSSSEGIYEGFFRQWRDEYVTGWSDTAELATAEEVRIGLRQEYTPELGHQPELYLSAVDHKLHLRNAWAGVWNIDDRQRIRYGDLDGDGILDRWMLTVASGRSPEKVVKEVYVGGGLAIYHDAARLRLVRAEPILALFGGLPPANHEDWLELEAALKLEAPGFAPTDLMSMIEQFTGPTTDVEAATLSGLGLAADGLHFVVSLAPGFRVTEDANGVGLAELQPGSYLVSYDGEFRHQPLAPPHLDMTASSLAFDSQPTQAAWTTVRATVRNSGQQDVASIPLRLLATRGNAPPQILAEEQVFVPGGGELVVEGNWRPQLPGAWTVWVEADASAADPLGTEIGELAQREVEVHPAADVSMLRPAGPYDGVRLSWPALLLLGSAGLAATCLVWIILRARKD
jgi:hypothetical protein